MLIPVDIPKHASIKMRSTNILFADKVLNWVGKYRLKEKDNPKAKAPPPMVWLVIYLDILWYLYLWAYDF